MFSLRSSQERDNVKNVQRRKDVGFLYYRLLTEKFCLCFLFIQDEVRHDLQELLTDGQLYKSRNFFQGIHQYCEKIRPFREESPWNSHEFRKVVNRLLTTQCLHRLITSRSKTPWRRKRPYDPLSPWLNGSTLNTWRRQRRRKCRRGTSSPN